MKGPSMVERPFAAALARWVELLGLPADRVPAPAPAGLSARPPARGTRIAEWERGHGLRLPLALRQWLRVSDGLYRGDSPLIHPLASIGPMVPFARVPELVVQPESWLELGNPGAETLCIDLGYRRPDGDCPLFASGDDERGTRPRLIAVGFDAWLLRLVAEGGRSFWLDPTYRTLGDPWDEHRRRAPAPELPARLRQWVGRVRPLMRPGADERQIADVLGISRGDVEALFRHLQHAAPG
jgi:hypothetical protein